MDAIIYLSAYLPYAVGFKHSEGLTKLNESTLNYWVTNYYNDPILTLRPLSGLMKEMNLDTDQFEIIEELTKVSDGSLCEEEWIGHLVDFYSKPQEIDFMQCPYRLMQYLLSEHWDVLKLIPEGLAVEINSINH